jgi:hypothetical protein
MDSNGKFRNCWEFMNCGREMAGEKAAELGVCPAWPNHGRVCAHVIGTLCGGQVEGCCAATISDCRDCDFFKGDNYDSEMAKFLEA